ncbi:MULTISPECIES: SLAP domain-containing protein [Heyndrickxia]|uniref:SLAP domain-containing protein n=1 Tax=Heyndrickxia TaxID=2837504 RepID=UPI001B13F0FD|nr:SLAP domain-containing protein [Heyndrickxia oleronia]GIN41873.1 hypothetical protein J19TS1_48220 [Heyndrickxia oleronia]
MQKLMFESAWDKTLSTKDRNYIEQIFVSTSMNSREDIQFTPIWQARNHKSELLITVLVHNFSEHPFSFHNTNLQYIENNHLIAEHTFQQPTPIVEQQTSMPWTFIFPVLSIKSSPSMKDGTLEIVEQLN